MYTRLKETYCTDIDLVYLRKCGYNIDIRYIDNRYTLPYK